MSVSPILNHDFFELSFSNKVKVEWAEIHVSVKIRAIRVIRVLFKPNLNSLNQWPLAFFNMKRNEKILKYNL